jgi:hypothetical protein
MIEIDVNQQELDKFDEDFDKIVGYDPKLFSSDTKLLAMCLMSINNNLDDIKESLTYKHVDEGVTITTIDALGNIVCGDDYFENSYYGITGLYATDKYVITGTISIDEVISMIIKSNDVERARFLNMYLQLTPNQIDLLLEKYGEHIEPYIEYYQYHNPDAFNDYYKLKRTL